MDDATRRREEDWERSLATWKAKQNKENNIQKPIFNHPNPYQQKTATDSTFLTKFLIFLAFAIPATILGYALYINFLPFGYEKTYTLTIDENGVISPLSNEIYLETPKGKKLLTLPNGVEDQVNLVIKPNVVLKDAIINVAIEGEGVYLAAPLTNELEIVEWDYNWDFTSSIPEDWQGTAQYDSEQACAHFNAYEEQTLSLQNSQDMFESGPMSIYVKWKPSQVSQFGGNNQQIVGHYNWEIWQSENNVQFRVGRMNDANGSTYSVNYAVNESFFNQEHEALAVYSPDEEGNGYIEFWVDNNFVGRTTISTDTIYQNYNENNNLNFAWSSHNNRENPHFDGCIYSAKISNNTFSQESKSTILSNINSKKSISIIGNGLLSSISLKVSQ